MNIALIFILCISVTSAIFLECDFKFASFAGLGSVYFCNVKGILNSPYGYNGSHIGKRTTDDVRGVRFFANICQSEIPSGLLNIFPNLIALGFFNCPITFLSGYELKNYSKLEVFELTFSNVERIPENFFAFTKNLSHINLSNNKIKFTGSNLLDHLNQMKRVNFERNICIDMRAQNEKRIRALIEILNENCREFENYTTTVAAPPSVPTSSMLTTTVNNNECNLEDVEKKVCTLVDQVEVIDLKIQNLTEENQILNTSLNLIKSEVANLQITNEEFHEKFNEHSKTLIELERLIIELSSRPCSCK